MRTRVCGGCGKHNRIPAEHLHDAGKCGACGQVLPAAAEPMDVEASELDEIVASAHVPVLIDFWAEWCAPCRMAAPIVKKVARDLSGRAIVLKVNTEVAPDVAARFGVRGIPTFVVMKDGRPVVQQAGLVDERQMRAWIDQAASAAR